MAASLGTLAKRIEAAGMRALKLAEKNVAFAMESLVQEGFDEAVDPYGEAWRPKKSGAGKPLQDTGKLAASFHVTTSPGTVSVASSDPRALWHQEGTATYRGKEPYTIVPKTKKALAIPVANKGGWTHPSTGDYLQVPGRKLVKPGKTKAKGAGRRILGSKVTASILCQSVRHPGVPPRKMLPEKGNIPERWRAPVHRAIESAVARAFLGITG